MFRLSRSAVIRKMSDTQKEVALLISFSVPDIYLMTAEKDSQYMLCIIKDYCT